MTKMRNAIVFGAVAALMSAGAIAATLPAAGEMPIVDNAVAISVQEAPFEVLATRSMPASGELNGVASTATGSALTRAQVENRFLQAEHNADAFPDASGERAL